MNKPKKIFHCGDQHIFFTKKFEEHEYVFNELYKEIEKEHPDLIVCAGDLLDSKTKLSGEQFELARSFLFNLSSHCPVLIILGNHDLNLKNKERKDLLSPVINSLNNEVLNPIHFFKNSGCYELYGIKWAIWSCLDEQKTPEITRNINDYIIGLYHGPVKGCLSDNGFILHEGIEISEFKDCDRVMMADIHKQQSFRNGEIVYSGSLLQTKISEPANGSYILWEWDGANYNATVKHLKNIYSTVTIDINSINESIPEDENQLLLLKYDANKISKTEALKIKKEWQQKLKNKIELKPSAKRKNKLELSFEEIKTQKNLNLKNALEEYLNNLNLTQEEKDSIFELDDYYSNNLNVTNEFETGDFSIYNIELNNFLSFAPHPQIIDFDKEGIIGIGGKNRVGKSSVIKSILFCLYNSSPDNNASLKKLINKHNREKESYVKIIFSKVGKFYKISRYIIPKKNSVSTNLTFEEIDEDGNVIKNLTGEKRQETEKEIQKYFGLESAFEILSLFSAQKRQQELIDCKNAEKLKLVNRFIGSNNYEDKYNSVNEDLKVEKGVYQNILKNFNQSKNLEEMEAKLIDLLKQEEELTNEVLESQSDEKIYEFKNRHLLSNYEINKKIANKIVSNPDDVKIEIEEIKAKIETEKEIKKGVFIQLEDCIINKENLKINFVDKYKGDIVQFKIDWKAIKPKEDKLAVIKSEVKRLTEQLSSDICNTCNKPFTKTDKKKIEKEISCLTEEQVILQNEINEENEKNIEIDKIKDKYNELEKYISQSHINMNLYNDKIENLKMQIENLQLKTKDWDEVQSAKLRLEEIEKEYIKYSSHKKEFDKSLEFLQNKIGAIKSEIKLLKKEIEDYKIQFEELKKSEEKMTTLKLYKDIVNKDGLPLFILNSKISEINEQVNLIVSQVFDFEVEFSINEGELNVEFFYENDTEKNDVGFASGAETFIINLCIKVGLSQISELPKLTSLLIDEGYGTLDADSISKIPLLFEVLPEYYKNIITISHIDELKDLYNYEVKLKKEGRYTEVIN